jgi:hypothetical protein
MSLKMIIASQVMRLHVLKQHLRMSEQDYRAALGGYGVATCKDLLYQQAAELINKFEAEAVQRGVWVKRDRPAAVALKYDNLGKRPGMSSPAQLRMIEAMWMDVSTQPTREAKERAMNHFISRITGIDNITWLDPVSARMVVRAIEAMKQGDHHGTAARAATA